MSWGELGCVNSGNCKHNPTMMSCNKGCEFYLDKDFQKYWGNKGEKWNGKLDIKNFAHEIWTEARKKVRR